jgi:hypothetical protein
MVGLDEVSLELEIGVDSKRFSPSSPSIPRITSAHNEKKNKRRSCYGLES